jgi:RNA ligase (TIGR02306 family)
LNDDNQSEFICHVVRIIATEPHPAADRLELVTISLNDKDNFPDKIINSKGDLQPGQLVVYVGPDSVVPLDPGLDGTPSPFAFLRERLDAKGKTHYRIRSARIRGIYSPGLLIRLPMVVLSMGTSMAEYLGVTNWESDRGLTKEGTTSSVSSVCAKDIYPVYTVYSLRKCPSIFKEGELVSVTEKIHGTNFRFGYGGRKRFYYGTHRTNLSDNRGFLARLRDFVLGRSRTNTNPGFNNPWRTVVDYYALEKECKDAPEYIFYAEIYGPGIQKGWDYGKKVADFAVFDVWYPKEKRWLNPGERNVICWSCEFNMVPHVLNTPYTADYIKCCAEHDSAFGGIREGVVVESRETGKKAKWVSERYRMSKDD